MKSSKNIGEEVIINFGEKGVVMAIISAVKFNDMSVLYDVKVFPFSNEPESKHISVEIKDIPSYYVELPQDRFIGKTNMPVNFIN